MICKRLPGSNRFNEEDEEDGKQSTLVDISIDLLVSTVGE